MKKFIDYVWDAATILLIVFGCVAFTLGLATHTWWNVCIGVCVFIISAFLVKRW